MCLQLQVNVQPREVLALMMEVYIEHNSQSGRIWITLLHSTCSSQHMVAVVLSHSGESLCREIRPGVKSLG